MPERRSKRQREAADPVARHLGGLQTEVMAVFWERDGATVRELVDALNARRRPKLAYTTVLTLATRLWQRGLLVREPEGRGFRYRAATDREGLLADLSDALIDQLFDDFGEIALARLDARLETLDASRKPARKAAKRR
jgi:predicted transcriptional regulator